MGGASGIGIGSLDPFFDLAAGLFAVLFDGGRWRAERDAAVAAYQESLALYRRPVLIALVEVALYTLVASERASRGNGRDPKSAREAEPETL